MVGFQGGCSHLSHPATTFHPMAFDDLSADLLDLGDDLDTRTDAVAEDDPGTTFRKKLARAMDRWERKQLGRAHKLEVDQCKRDMGIGYLVWAIRRQNRISQRQLAARVGVTASALCRWESGNRVPSLTKLQAMAHENDYELIIGLWDRNEKEIAVLGIVEHELPVAELNLIEDRYVTESPPPRPWRERLPNS